MPINHACIVGTGNLFFVLLIKIIKVFNRIWTISDIVAGFINEVTITGLKPESRYEVKLSAINGKGEGESSPTELFKTEPVRKCTVYNTV